MTIEELRIALLGKTYPDPVQISADQRVTDAENFLKIQFIEVDLWTREIEKCPAYLRLLKFFNATKPQ
ncbi:hypothetical protein HP439_16145 [Sphingobacterium shayense]|uniref:DUF6965 family protein n=1 Tax=Sphingobacterium shayense TaxID=626343 RepID=UPI001556F049|nr:hypothetical protein [Sphingobacterium shayense]NQD72257.1 hypothetical protein [Sphingobacterium shayense]